MHELEPLELSEHARLLEKRDIVLARESLLHLILAVKPDYRLNFHHFLMCERFSRLADEPGSRIILTVPPQYGKSEVVSRFLPAWILGRMPAGKIILASYAATLAHGFNRDCQRIMDTDIYKQIFPRTKIAPQKGMRLKRTSELVETSKGGYLYTVGVGGATTGRSADPLFIVDDPFKDLQDAMNPNYRQKVKDWYAAVAQTRVSRRSSIVIMHTRWHEDDLAGYLLNKGKNDPQATQWEIVNFPALADKADELHPEDPRNIGDALWPDHKSNEEELERIRRDVGSIIWNALYQQRPKIDGGNLVQSSWWRYYKVRPEDDEFEEWILSLDAAFKDLDTSDYVVIQVWARKGVNKYLIDQIRGHMDVIKTVQMMKMTAAKYPRAHTKIIEEGANGIAVIQLLSQKMSGILGIKPRDSKIARVVAISPQIEAGNVHIPHPDFAPFPIEDFVDEFTSFPRGSNDDQVDACSQALDRLSRSENNYLRKLLRKDD